MEHNTAPKPVKTGYRQNDVRLRNDIIALIRQHSKDQGDEKMLKSFKLKIEDTAENPGLDIKSIEMSWQFKKVRKRKK